MKNSIHGFKQRAAVCIIGLTGDDLMFLRWFVDFSHSPKMKKKLIDGDVYYWINYEAVLKDLPILNVGKYQLRRRILEHLVDTKVLKHKQVREKGPNGGTFSYYAFGEAYDLLIEDDADKPQNPHKAAIPCGEKVTSPVPEMQQQRPFLHSDLSFKQAYKASPSNGIAGDGHFEKFPKDQGPMWQQAEKPEAEGETFSAELQNFVDSTYPALFEQYIGHQHPHLKPYQRIRTLTILRAYLQDYTEDIDALEAAAEEFLSDCDFGDGNILAFANPQTISIRLVRMGFDDHIGDCACLHQ